MSCQGCQDSAAGTANQTRSFDAAFARFWPEHQPFPPATPWLAAAVSRAEAKQWAVDVGADRDPGVLAGDMQAMLHVVGLAMAGGGGYANVRDGKKKKKGTPPLIVTQCWEAARLACSNQGGVATYDYKDGWCSWTCRDQAGPFPDDPVSPGEVDTP